MDQSKQQGQSDSPNLSPFVDPQSHTQHIPKLEDVLGDSSSMVRYSDSQTETHDSSSLTHMYDQSPTHVGWRGKSDGDGISLFGARKIWIDHCSLSFCTDGLIDAIMGSTGITISNNYFAHHDEVMPVGTLTFRRRQH
ncbi:hypothetical protein PS2_005467 [Malus domestica]